MNHPPETSPTLHNGATALQHCHHYTQLLSRVTRLKAGLREAEQALEVKRQVLQAFYEASGETGPIRTRYAEFGYRPGMPAVHITDGLTEEQVINLLQRLAPRFIRQRQEIERRLLLAARTEIADLLPQLGLEIRSEPKFYVK